MPRTVTQPAFDFATEPATQVRGDDAAYLRAGGEFPQPERGDAGVSVVDLFCGCGGLSLGLAEAARDAGRRPVTGAAVDFEPAAAAVYADNFGADRLHVGDVTELFPLDLAAPRTDREAEIARACGGRASFLVGGPPCQGHSDLNNHTRRADPKNALYSVMARAAVALDAEAVLVENVPGARFDRAGVVQATAGALVAAGYHVSSHTVDLSKIGVPQNRKRFILLGTRRPCPTVPELIRPYLAPSRDLRWAIGDLEDVVGEGIMDVATTSSPETARRIDYLFDEGVHDLPNSERPACHRDKAHTYENNYGRLHWDRPAPTITGGFYTMGMGRYVHPSRRRTITGREAARIQFFPDSFRFDAAPNRSALAKMVANAVPPKLTYAIGLELLRLGVVRGPGR